MTTLEKFVAFAEALPEDRRHAIEELLASVMDSDLAEFDLTADETTEIDRRRGGPSGSNIDGAKVLARMRKLAR